MKDLNAYIDYRKAEKIIELTCLEYDIKAGWIKANTRRKEIVLPRQVAMFIISERTHLKQVAIGLLLGGLDHATVSQAVKTIGNNYETYEYIRNAVDSIEGKLI